MNFSQMGTFWNLFRQGEAVANPAAWHDASSQAHRIGLFILLVISAVKSYGITQVFGISIDIDQPTAFAIAGGISYAVLWVLNNITSVHAGFLPAKPISATVS